MSAFEFVFSLFGLLLGLSLVEVLGGLVRTIKAKRTVRIGWLTPLLGILTMVHLTTFWADAWRIRDSSPVTNLSLLVGLLITGIYYYAASFVFPERPEEWENLDEHYDRNKKTVLVGILLCQLISTHAAMAAQGGGYSTRFFIVWALFGALFLAPAFVKNRKISGALLLFATALFTFMAVLAR